MTRPSYTSHASSDVYVTAECCAPVPKLLDGIGPAQGIICWTIHSLLQEI